MLPALPRMVRGRVLRALLGVGILVGSSAAMGQSVSILPVGDRQVLYRWATDRCEDQFIPDSPARAFRRSDGSLVLMATHKENWRLAGPDFAHLKPVCGSVMRSSALQATGVGELWIQALYSDNGKRVAALVSEDRTSLTRHAGCVANDQPGRCWLNNLLGARSLDGGASYALTSPETRVVASLAAVYPDRAKGRFGAFTASNIVRRDGYYYVMVFLQGEDRSGNCLLRTDDPFAPERWRGWDGSDFTLRLRAEASQACTLLPTKGLPAEVRTLVFDVRRRVWIAVFLARLRLAGDDREVPGFYFSVSPDMLAWGTPARIMAAPVRPRFDSQTETMGYPSLLDPDSRSRNFDTLDGEAPVLLFMVHHMAPNGRGTLDRDLQFVKLRLQ